MEMPLKEAISLAIDDCISEGVLSDFFKKYRSEIIEADVLDCTFEARLRMHEEAHQRDIRKYEELLAEKDETLAEKDKTLENQAETMAEKDKALANQAEKIERLLKEIELLKSSGTGTGTEPVNR